MTEHEKIQKDIRQALSLRKPQAESLEILAKVSEELWGSALGDHALPDLTAQLKAVQKICPTIKDFDRDFCSLCFALATGVGKTRLMGAFIAYLNQAYGVKNFVVIAPNLTIYEKLISDFAPNSPKYVFKGIAPFAANLPIIITGESYQGGKGVITDDLFQDSVVINIFNIAKLTAKDKGHFAAGDKKAKVAKIRRISEMIGESYFEYLAGRDDLVVLMDESHRYRAEAGATAINELKPILGIELTATPRVIKGQKEIPFRNIAYEYNLAAAMKDGFVKEPAIATRKGFNITDHAQDSPELERLKLNDGALIHENTKAALANWAQNHNKPVTKPFMLVVAADKAHADELEAFMASDDFRKGAYKGKIVKVYSGMSAADDEKMVGQLLEIEKPGNEIEIVIHVNKLSEGWDVTNLYTIVPLRAANSVNLVEQSIGRGLRLPYGERTGEEAVDTVTVVSHDRYAEIINKAKSESLVMFKSYIIDEDGNDKKKATVQMAPATNAIIAASKCGALGDRVLPSVGADHRAARNSGMPYIPESAGISVEDLTPSFGAALEAIQEAMDERAGSLTACDLTDTATFKAVVAQAEEKAKEIDGTAPDKKEIEKAAKAISALTIFIPRVFREPKGEVVQSFEDFTIDTAELKTLNPVDDKIKITDIRTGEGVKMFDGGEGDAAANHLVTLIGKLRKMGEIDYDGNSELVAKLAQEAVLFLEGRSGKENAANIVRNNMDRISTVIRDQLMKHARYEGGGYEFKIVPGCLQLGLSSALIGESDKLRDFSVPLKAGERRKISSMVFTGFKKCLYEKQKFESEPERMFGVIVDRAEDVVAWLRPQYSNFAIRRNNGDNYFADFVVETKGGKYICEVKADSEADDADVIDKANAAIEWCRVVSEVEIAAGRKPWRYVFVKESQIDEALEFDVAVQKFTVEKAEEV